MSQDNSQNTILSTIPSTTTLNTTLNISQSILLTELKKLLKSSRLKAGYNYKELSKILNISDQTLKKYENDLSMDIPINKLFSILKSLNISSSVIVHYIKLFY